MTLCLEAGSWSPLPFFAYLAAVWAIGSLASGAWQPLRPLARLAARRHP